MVSSQLNLPVTTDGQGWIANSGGFFPVALALVYAQLPCVSLLFAYEPPSTRP